MSAEGVPSGVIPDPADMRAMIARIYWDAITRRERYVSFVNAPIVRRASSEAKCHFDITRQNLHTVEAVAANDQVIIAAALALGLQVGLRGAEQTPPPAA